MSRWADKYVIGLTGNIAVGKSVVRQMLQHLGAYTIDADGLTHQAMSPGAPAYKPVVEAFGQFILDEEKRINRAVLGSIAFSNPAALAKLEAITHPIIGQAINTLISRAKQQVIVIEAIKLLEGDLANAVDTVWVVDSTPEVQLKRLMEKRKLTEADAKQRIIAQSAQADKVKRADLVINNNGNVEDTWKQVQMGWGQIKKALVSSAPPPAPAPPAPAPQKPAAPAPSAAPAAPAAPAQQPPAPSPAVDEDEIPITAAPAGLEVKRGMPSNAQQIADFINKVAQKGLDRMDIMMAFGQKSYLLAQLSNETVVAVAGWQVENLITRVDELYFDQSTPRNLVVQGLVNAIEEASKALQSEVGFIFLPVDTEAEIVSAFATYGYEKTTVAEIKIPAWREAVQESLTDNLQILRKQLRKDRVLQPI